MSEQQANQNQEVESVKALKVIRDLTKKAKDLNLVEAPSATGWSYFMGKKRLCKLLQTKRGIALELNVQLPADLAKLAGMDTISVAQARKKHLGTMKHMYRSSDSKLVPDILAAALAVFKKEVEAAKAEEAKAEAKEAQAQAKEA